MADRNDPVGVFNFVVEINGVRSGAFSEVSGMEAEVAVIEYRTGAEDIAVRKIPGLRKYNNVILKRGVTADPSLWNWFKTVLDGKIQRADILITLLDPARQPVVRWRLREAWICKWTGPALNAKGNDVAIESLELAHEGWELVE